MTVYKDAHLTINGTDVSEYLESLELPLGRDALEKTAMGDETHVNEPGLKTWTITANFHQSFVDNELDETLFGLFDAGTTFTVATRPTTASKGVNNPEFSGSGFISQYTPMTGQVGTHLVVPVTIVASGDLSRATA